MPYPSLVLRLGWMMMEADRGAGARVLSSGASRVEKPLILPYDHLRLFSYIIFRYLLRAIDDSQATKIKERSAVPRPLANGVPRSKFKMQIPLQTEQLTSSSTTLH